MKRIYISLLLALMALPMMAQLPTITLPRQSVFTSMDPSRYDMVQSTIVRRQSFMLDKFTGRVWQMVQDDKEQTLFQEVYVEDIPNGTETEPTYKLFIGGTMAADCFLFNTKTGDIWQFVKYGEDSNTFFARITRNDGTIHPQILKEWREDQEMGLLPYSINSFSVEDMVSLRSSFRSVYLKFSNWGYLYLPIFEGYRDVMNWVRTSPSAETVEGMKEINRYMNNLDYGHTLYKIGKKLKDASSVEEQYNILLEVSRSEK